MNAVTTVRRQGVLLAPVFLAVTDIEQFPPQEMPTPKFRIKAAKLLQIKHCVARPFGASRGSIERGVKGSSRACTPQAWAKQALLADEASIALV